MTLRFPGNFSLFAIFGRLILLLACYSFFFCILFFTAAFFVFFAAGPPQFLLLSNFPVGTIRLFFAVFSRPCVRFFPPVVAAALVFGFLERFLRPSTGMRFSTCPFALDCLWAVFVVGLGFLCPCGWGVGSLRARENSPFCFGVCFGTVAPFILVTSLGCSLPLLYVALVVHVRSGLPLTSLRKFLRRVWFRKPSNPVSHFPQFFCTSLIPEGLFWPSPTMNPFRLSAVFQPF